MGNQVRHRCGIASLAKEQAAAIEVAGSRRCRSHLHRAVIGKNNVVHIQARGAVVVTPIQILCTGIAVYNTFGRIGHTRNTTYVIHGISARRVDMQNQFTARITRKLDIADNARLQTPDKSAQGRRFKRITRSVGKSKRSINIDIAVFDDTAKQNARNTTYGRWTSACSHLHLYGLPYIDRDVFYTPFGNTGHKTEQYLLSITIVGYRTTVHNFDVFNGTRMCQFTAETTTDVIVGIAGQVYTRIAFLLSVKRLQLGTHTGVIYSIGIEAFVLREHAPCRYRTGRIGNRMSVTVERTRKLFARRLRHRSKGDIVCQIVVARWICQKGCKITLVFNCSPIGIVGSTSHTARSGNQLRAGNRSAGVRIRFYFQSHIDGRTTIALPRRRKAMHIHRIEILL